LAYGVKFALKAAESDFVVPPFETLWWADDMSSFTKGKREEWQWTAMLRIPDDLSLSEFTEARETVVTKQEKKKEGVFPRLLRAVRVAQYAEGDCLQYLHVGPFAEEAPILAKLHDNVMPSLGLAFVGNHHEVYLSDPRRVAQEKLKTILRQPVKPAKS